uniref:Uncharacterized protein n=2 Tax=Caenorhabditis japonica TaxID=281687 RepID=A0A8R1ICI3_CAEJA
MRTLIFVISMLAFVATAAFLPKSVHPEPHKIDDKNSVQQEIFDALKDIDASLFLCGNDTASDEQSPAAFFENIGNMFNGMISAVHNSNVPFFGENVSENKQQKETVVVGKPAGNEAGLIDRTRTELKEDIESLRLYLDNIRAEFDEWVISNRHIETKAMILGALSAVFVLISYYVICKCCRRRSRMSHLSAFANDGFSRDTEGLLPTSVMLKKGRHPSNSDEDI